MWRNRTARSRVCAYLAVFAGAAMVFACADGPSGPATAPAPGPAPASSLRLIAPPEMEPGEVIQLRLVRTGAAGEQDVTDRGQWHSGNERALALSPTGLATAHERGESTVSASFEGQTSTARILLLPRGTFRLGGVIREPNGQLTGVNVTVLSGEGTGLTDFASQGSYALYGVKGPVRLGLRRAGYVDVEHEVVVNDHMQMDLTMMPEGPSTILKGRYSLTFFTSGCPAGFPEAAARRTYTADVDQNGGGLRLSLVDSSLIVSTGSGTGRTGTTLHGWVFPTGDTHGIWIGTDFYDYHATDRAYGIAERVGDMTILIRGIASGSGNSERVEGTVAGKIYIGATTTSPFEPITAECPINSFELTRQ